MATDSMSVAAFSDEPATPAPCREAKEGHVRSEGVRCAPTGEQAACICTDTIAVHTHSAQCRGRVSADWGRGAKRAHVKHMAHVRDVWRCPSSGLLKANAFCRGSGGHTVRAGCGSGGGGGRASAVCTQRTWERGLRLQTSGAARGEQRT